MEQANKQSIIIGDILHRAWDLLSGAKWAIWMMVILMAVVGGVLSFFLSGFFGASAKEQSFLARFIILPVITNFFVAPFYAGAIMAAVKQARGEKVSTKTGFHYFNRCLPVALTLITITIIGSLAIMLVNSPAIASSSPEMRLVWDLIAGVFSLLVFTFCILAIPLVADKKLSPFAAIKQSVQRIKPHWLKILLLWVIGYLIILAIGMPMIIGVIINHPMVMILGTVIFIIAAIWMLPFLFLIHGEIYHRLVD